MHVVLDIRPVPAHLLDDVVSELRRSVCPEGVEGGTNEVLLGAFGVIVVPRAGVVGVGRLSKGQHAAKVCRRCTELTVGRRQRKHR